MSWIDKRTKSIQGGYFAKMGKKDKALAIAKELLLLPNGKMGAAFVYVRLGMAHEAVQLMHESFKVNKYWTSYAEMINNPCLEPIRNSPEFQELLRQQKPIYDESVAKYRIK